MLAFDGAAGALAFGAKDVAGAERTERGVMVRLGPEAAAAFADLTGRSVGKPIALSVCGEVLMEPVVQEAITGGQIMISGNREAMADLLDQLTGVRPCP